MRTTTRVWKKAAALLTLAMALGWVLWPSVALALTGGKTIACLGTAGITVPNDGWSKSAGSYVYYGTYNGPPTKYRVLANGTTDFGGMTMLLDCDTILDYTKYDDKSNAWSESLLQGWVTIDENGKFGATDNKLGQFTPAEVGAIAKSTKVEGDNAYGTKDYALAGEQAFVLSVSEAKQYYTADDASSYNPSRAKDNHDWWLRSEGKETVQHTPCVAAVNEFGHVVEPNTQAARSVNTANVGVSPAFNINLSSVIFSSAISGEAGQPGPEYKLTIQDGGLTATGSATLYRTEATIAYSTTGEATQTSYLVTNAEWTESGWATADGASPVVLAYGSLGEAGSDKTGGFTLPDGCLADQWGTSYHVYVLAETLSGVFAADYASAPAEVGAPTIYTISAAADPEEGGTATASAEKAAEGAEVALEAEEADGYEFVNWTVTGEGATLEDADKLTAKLTVGAADATATAHFREKAAATHKVTLTGGRNAHTTGGTTKQDVEEGEAMDAVTYTAEDGYRFPATSELYKETGGVTVARTGDTVVAVSGTPTADLEIIVPDALAVTAQTVTVTFDANGGKGTMQALAGDEGSRATLPRCTFTREGYAFAGWNTQADGRGTAYADGATVSLDADVTLYAQWRAEPKPVATFTVTLAGGANASIKGATTQSVEAGRTMAVVTYVANEGFHFDSFDPIKSNGVSAAFREGNVVVFGTPIADVRLTVPDAVADPAPGELRVTYAAHVAGPGWLPYVSDGETAGTTGEFRRMEALKVRLMGAPVPGTIEYRAHLKTTGWEDAYVSDDAVAGTTGEFRRMEAVRIRLRGEVEARYDVWYRVHSQTYGWLGWACNDQPAGTTGLFKRAEAVQVLLLPKGSPAPGPTDNALITN